MSAFFQKHPSERDLALFAGGESGPFARWRVERHLESCPRCKEEVASFFRLQQELSPLAELPDVDWNSLAESIEQALPAATTDSLEAPSKSLVPAWGYGLGAVATAALLAFVLQSPWTQTAQEPVVETASLEMRQEKLDQPVALSEAFEGPEADKEADALAKEERAPVAAPSVQPAEAGLRARAAASTPSAPIPSAPLLADSARADLDAPDDWADFTEIVAVSDDGVLTITEVYAD